MAHHPYAGMPLLVRLCLRAARRLARLALRLLLMVLAESYYRQRRHCQPYQPQPRRCYKFLRVLAALYNIVVCSSRFLERLHMRKLYIIPILLVLMVVAACESATPTPEPRTHHPPLVRPQRRFRRPRPFPRGRLCPPIRRIPRSPRCLRLRPFPRPRPRPYPRLQLRPFPRRHPRLNPRLRPRPDPRLRPGRRPRQRQPR